MHVFIYTRHSSSLFLLPLYFIFCYRWRQQKIPKPGNSLCTSEVKGHIDILLMHFILHHMNISLIGSCGNAVVRAGCCHIFVVVVVSVPVRFEAYQSQHSDVIHYQQPSTASSNVCPLPSPGNSSAPPLTPRTASLMPKPNAVVNGRVQAYQGRAPGEPPLQIINS